VGKERSGGLNDLRHILQHNRGNTELGRINDKSFHKIFEALFEVAFEERSVYLKSLKSTAQQVQTSAITRFTNCSQTLRLAVERGAKNIRLRTLKALLDHVTETLLDANGACCVPIALDYARCLSTVLSHQPHVEHLKDVQWTKVTRFCLDRIASSISSDTTEASFVVDRVSATSRSSITSSRGPSDQQRAYSSGGLSKQAVDEFVNCLRHLTSLPSVPLVKDAEPILSTMLDYLDASQSANQAQVNALTTINNVLLQIRAEKTQLTISYVSPCVQMARSLWNSKLFAVRNEILVMLVLLHTYILHTVSVGEDTSLSTSLDALVGIIRNDYARRDTKDQLRLDDLRMPPHSGSIGRDLEFPIFSLRDGTATATNAPDGEHNWALLRLTTYFSISNSLTRGARGNDSEPPPNGAKKRVKLSHWSDELLRLLHDSHTSSRVCGIQLITFAAQSTSFDQDFLEHVLERLSALCTDENGLVASWALLGLAR